MWQDTWTACVRTGRWSKTDRQHLTANNQEGQFWHINILLAWAKPNLDGLSIVNLPLSNLNHSYGNCMLTEHSSESEPRTSRCADKVTFTFLLTLLKLKITCLAGGGPLHLTKKLILENNRKHYPGRRTGEREPEWHPRKASSLCLSSGFTQLMIAMNTVTHKIGNLLKV